MGRCSEFCKFPELDVDSSHHRCANSSCQKKFHAICGGDVYHPQATELGLTMGNDMLCPSCASVFNHSGVLPSFLSSENHLAGSLWNRSDDISVSKKRTEISHDDTVNGDSSSATERTHHKKPRNKHVTGSDNTSLKKLTPPEPSNEVVDVTNFGTANDIVTTPVLYKKQDLNELYDESWGYDFSADVPIDFPIVSATVAKGQSKVVPNALPTAPLQTTVTVVDAIKHCSSMLHPHIVDGHPTSNVGIEDVVIGGENNRLSNSLDHKSSASSENIASNTTAKIVDCAVPAVQSPISNVEDSVSVDDDNYPTTSSVNTVSSSLVGNKKNGVVLKSFLDIVNMSAHTCCGYRFILRMVDPIARVGHATVMKSKSPNDVIVAFPHLMRVARVEPTEIYYDTNLSFLASLVEHYPNVTLIMTSFSDVMSRECAMYISQMQRWIKCFGNKWLRAAVTVQAVMNTLPL